MDTPLTTLANEDSNPTSTETTTESALRKKTRTLRQRNLISPNPKPLNVEEQIIQKRGRRIITKPTTPTSPLPTLKRRLDDSNNNNDNNNNPNRLPHPKESPFTKCLRGLSSPIHLFDQSSNTTFNFNESSSSLNLSSSSKKFYYSPNPPYQLRSMDVTNRSSTSTTINSSIEFNDSGIVMSPDVLDTTTNSSSNNADSGDAGTTTTNSSGPKTRTTTSNDKPLNPVRTSTTTTKRINHVRRRFRF